MKKYIKETDDGNTVTGIWLMEICNWEKKLPFKYPEVLI
jgi:hypothetical protein